MSIQLQQAKERIGSWWQRRGNRILPELYFHPLSTFLIVYFVFFIFSGALAAAFVDTVIQYVMQGEINRQAVTFSHALGFLIFYSLFMVAIYGILTFVILYMRAMATYTFIHERKTRKVILRRDYWSLFPRYVTSLLFLLAYYPFLSVVLLHTLDFSSEPLLLDVLTLIASTSTEYLPLACSLFVTFFFTSLLLELGASSSEKLPYIADSLANLREPKTFWECKKWKSDMVYLAGAFVKAFGTLSPFDHRIVEEVDLSYLKPILLALFLGNDKEKNKAKEMLSELQEYVHVDERKREINQINWLLKTKDSSPKAFPRLEKVEDILTMKLSIKKGILSATPESVKYIAKIIAILVGLTTVVSVIFGAIQFFLTLHQ